MAKAATATKIDPETGADVADATETGAPAPGAETAAAPAVRKAPAQMTAHDIQPAGTKWTSWNVVARDDHTMEDAIHPRYLWNKADQFNPLDEVTIKHPHGDWVIVLDVMSIDSEARAVFTKIRHILDYSQEQLAVPKPDLSGARVEFLGSDEWGITDGHFTVRSGFKTRQEAESYLRKKRRELSE